jgi:hypothetical protein
MEVLKCYMPRYDFHIGFPMGNHCAGRLFTLASLFQDEGLIGEAIDGTTATAASYALVPIL